MKALCFFGLALVMALMIWHGSAIRDGNAALDARCQPYGGTYHAVWDGATLVAVVCENDERRFKR